MPCTPNQSSTIGNTTPQAPLSAAVSNMNVALATYQHYFRNNYDPHVTPGVVVGIDWPGRSLFVANTRALVEGGTAPARAMDSPVPFKREA